MKELALIVLIMVLGLSGCASSGMSGLIIEDWAEYLSDPGSGDWKLIKWDWAEVWKDPGGGSWEAVKMDWTEFLN